jgi:hypothetical protein
MWPEQIGGSAVRAAVGRTEAVEWIEELQRQPSPLVA